MNRHPWLLLSGAVWVYMMYLLFDREVRPYFEYQAPPTYQTVFRDLRHAEVQRRAVYFAESRIGESESLSEPLEGGGVRMRSRILMKMALFGGIKVPDDRAYLTSDFKVDKDFQLAEFRLTGNLQGMPMSASGQRQGEQLRVAYNFLITKGDLLVPFPKDATLADSFLPYQGGGRLEDGKKWKIRMFDLGNLVSIGKDHKVDMTELYATVVGREKPPSRHEERMAWQIEVRRQPTDEFWAYLLWVDEEGLVLEQHMKINKLPCKIVLEERLRLPDEGLKDFKWKVESPR